MVELSTRRSLVEAAERLFAERGIDNVSLREINRAAGQRNVAALHYHFGTREALLEAIFEYRMADINERRVEMLDALAHPGVEITIRAIAEAMVLPLAAQLDPAMQGRHYVRFLAHAISDPGVDVGELVRDKFDHGMAQSRRMARQLLSDLPAEIVDQRVTLAGNYLVHALADEARRLGPHRIVSERTQFFVANLIDSIAGSLAAPASTETLTQFAELQTKSA